MNEIDPRLERLMAAARRAADAPAEAPYGFATRVAARAFTEAAPVLLRGWEALSFRFLVCSVAAMLLGLGTSQALPSLGDVPGVDDLTAEILTVEP